jgi:N6-adenosine-specific RNA methylase IME4
MTTFAELPRGFRTILADPPWSFATWSSAGKDRSPERRHYTTMTLHELQALDVVSLAADDCCLFLWTCWPMLPQGLQLIETWQFEFKTCAFCWVKAHARQLEMFQDDIPAHMSLGYWTRANSEVCLLATRGRPKRLNADVRQAIIEPARQHSRKPDCIYGRIERLAAGPYLELFARQRRPGWTAWGNEVGKYDAQQDITESVKLGFEVIRARVKAGGPGWGGG